VLSPDGTPRIAGPQDNTAAIAALRARFDRTAGTRAPFAPSRNFCWSLRTMVARYLPTGRPLDFLRRRAGGSSQLVPVAKFLLSRLNGEVAQHGGRLVILYIPNYFGAKVIPAPAYLVETARELGVPIVDPTSALQAAKARAPDAIMIPGDGHLTPWANALVADLLAAEIRRDRLLAP